MHLYAGEIEGTDVSITALTTSQGLVWVGTNTGHILTIPVPVSTQYATHQKLN